MPTISVKEDLQYFYLDNGAPGVPNYKTMIMIHGHTFHGATFKRLLPLAASRNIRIIAINRREYPGSTPLSQAERDTLRSGSDEERANLLANLGVDIACLIDALIKQLGLPRDIAIVAWSLGNVFLVSLLASVDVLPTDVRKSLTTSVKHIILWDPPSESLGLPLPPEGYIPLYDTELSPEECLAKFGVWVASYWKHGDLASHDPSQLNYRTPEKEPPPTSETLGEELFALADLTAGEKSDTSILQVHNHNVLSKLWDKALFDASVREAWAGSKFTHFYGDASTWNIIYTGWFLEDKVKGAATEKLLVHFKVVKGANHFVMWDNPEGALNDLEAIIST